MNQIQKLTELFSKFPGIGPRQAKRFVYFLLTQSNGFSNELSGLIKNVKSEVTKCTSCHRFFALNGDDSNICNICNDKKRESTVLMIVEKDVDLDNIERSGIYSGHYFVLGGTVPILDKAPEKKVRANQLVNHLNNNSFKEIILALSANPDGDNTGTYIVNLLKPITEKDNVKISQFGRGLSTGSELEYSDTETIRNAFNNRK